MIRVIDKYGIDASDRCYEVGKIGKTTDKKTGEVKEYIANASYVSSLQQALKVIRKKMHLEAIKNIDGDLHAAIEVIKKADERFEELIKDIEKV